jgi:glutamine amidotransferase-like uncharacterized protein
MSTISSISSIYLYVGDGGEEVHGTDVDKLKKIFQQAYPSSPIYEVTSSNFHPFQWKPNSLVALPGGKCSGWKWLNNSFQVGELREFIQQGNMLFGVCAGAYACCKVSEYAISSDFILKKERKLDLFEGTGMGPLIPDSGILSSIGPNARAIKVKWLSSANSGYVVLSGGGYFIPPFSEDKQENFEVLATYAEQPEEKSRAVVKCKVGKGLAVLSFPHFEYQSADYPLQNLEEMVKSSTSSYEVAQIKIEELSKTHSDLQSGDAFQLDCLQLIMDTFKRHVQQNGCQAREGSFGHDC